MYIDAKSDPSVYFHCAGRRGTLHRMPRPADTVGAEATARSITVKEAYRPQSVPEATRAFVRVHI